MANPPVDRPPVTPPVIGQGTWLQIIPITFMYLDSYLLQTTVRESNNILAHNFHADEVRNGCK